MDYNYMQIQAAKKLLRQKADGSIANLQARQQARALLREAANDFAVFAVHDIKSKPAEYLLGEAENLYNICDQSFYGEETPTERDRFLDEHELDLLSKPDIVKMLNEQDYSRWSHEELARALHRKNNLEDALC